MNVKPEDLPSLPIEWKSALPKCSGIYFAIDSEGRIQYIGRSKNINQRWAGHHRNEQLLKIGGVRIAWLEISDHSLLPDIESALIEWFVPPLNRVVVSREEECVLTSLRISARLTQKDIATALGVTVTTVQNWESGRRELKLTPKDMKTLCSVLGCSLDDLAEY